MNDENQRARQHLVKRHHDWNYRAPYDRVSSTCRGCGVRWDPVRDSAACPSPHHGPPTLSAGMLRWPGSLSDVEPVAESEPYVMKAYDPRWVPPPVTITLSAEQVDLVVRALLDRADALGERSVTHDECLELVELIDAARCGGRS